MDSTPFGRPHEPLGLHMPYQTPLFYPRQLPPSLNSAATPSPSSSFDSSTFASSPATSDCSTSIHFTDYAAFCTSPQRTDYGPGGHTGYQFVYQTSSDVAPARPQQQWQPHLPFRSTVPHQYNASTVMELSNEADNFHSDMQFRDMSIYEQDASDRFSMSTFDSWVHLEHERTVPPRLSHSDSIFSSTPAVHGDSFSTPWVSPSELLTERVSAWHGADSPHSGTVAPDSILLNPVARSTHLADLNFEEIQIPGLDIDTQLPAPQNSSRASSSSSNSVDTRSQNGVHKRRKPKRSKRSRSFLSDQSPTVESNESDSQLFDEDLTCRKCGYTSIRSEHAYRHWRTVHGRGAECGCPLKESGYDSEILWCKINSVRHAVEGMDQVSLEGSEDYDLCGDDSDGADDEDHKATNGSKSSSRMRKKRKLGCSRPDNRQQHFLSHVQMGGRNKTCEPGFLEYSLRTEDTEQNNIEGTLDILYTGVEREIIKSALTRLNNPHKRCFRIYDQNLVNQMQPKEREEQRIQEKHPLWAEYQEALNNPLGQAWTWKPWGQLLELQRSIDRMSPYELRAYINQEGLGNRTQRISVPNRVQYRERRLLRRTTKL